MVPKEDETSPTDRPALPHVPTSSTSLTRFKPFVSRNWTKILIDCSIVTSVSMAYTMTYGGDQMPAVKGGEFQKKPKANLPFLIDSKETSPWAMELTKEWRELSAVQLDFEVLPSNFRTLPALIARDAAFLNVTMDDTSHWAKKTDVYLRKAEKVAAEARAEWMREMMMLDTALHGVIGSGIVENDSNMAKKVALHVERIAHKAVRGNLDVWMTSVKAATAEVRSAVNAWKYYDSITGRRFDSRSTIQLKSILYKLQHGYNVIAMYVEEVENGIPYCVTRHAKEVTIGFPLEDVLRAIGRCMTEVLF